jgi:hypothetical protein
MNGIKFLYLFSFVALCTLPLCAVADHAGHDHSSDNVGAAAADATTTGTSSTPSVNMSGSMVASDAVLPPCAVDPTSTSCVSYNYPDDLAIADIKMNCEMMPFMIGCSVWRACQRGDMDADSKSCKPFSVLASLCIDQGMSGMSGCKVYTPLCVPASVVTQCREQSAIPRMVSTNPTQVCTMLSCAYPWKSVCNCYLGSIVCVSLRCSWKPSLTILVVVR